ncbi:hypothetical protein ACS386_13765 [Flavobacteriaceae bacterium LMO-SS05]
MKKFIRKLILFTIIPLLFVLAFDVYLRNINTLLSAKYEGLMEAKENIDVVFLGNSHASYSMNPYFFKNFNAYNLAEDNQKIYFDKRILKKAIDDGVSNLKYVFISVDYHSLYTSSQGIRNVWTYYKNGIKYKNQNYLKAEISPFLWGYTPKVAVSLLRKEIIRRIKYDYSVIDFDVQKGVNLNDTLTNGFIGLSGQDKMSFNELNYKVRAESFQENNLVSERKEVVADLESFIVYLKKNNIKPVLFSSPTFSEYNQFLDSVTIQKNKNDLNKICKKFNIQYWRYNEDVRFSNLDFYNQDHLNKRGAAKFSSIIDSRLLNYDKARTHNKTVSYN